MFDTQKYCKPSLNRAGLSFIDQRSWIPRYLTSLELAATPKTQSSALKTVLTALPKGYGRRSLAAPAKLRRGFALTAKHHASPVC